MSAAEASSRDESPSGLPDAVPNIMRTRSRTRLNQWVTT